MGDFAGMIHPEAILPGRAIQRALRSSHAPLPATGADFQFQNVEIGSRGCGVYNATELDVWVCIDGRLSNRKELIADLQLPDDCSDAFILASSYHRDRLKAIPKWQGEYAIALFDKVHSELVLVRDRFGQKPLYWYFERGFLVFGSQMKGLLRSGLVPPDPAIDGIASYLFFGFVPQDISMTRGVSRLLPSFYLRYSLEGQLRIENYWSYSAAHEKKHEGVASLEETTTLVHNALNRRSGKTSKLCAIWDGTLSGLTAAALLGQSQARGKHLFFLRSDMDPTIRERLDAQGVTFHDEPVTEKPAHTLLPALVWELDEPIATADAPALRQIAERLADQGATLLSSAGAQTLFGPPPRLQERRTGSFLSQLLNLLPEKLMLSGVIPITRYLNRNWSYELLRRYYRTALHGNYLRARALFVEQEIADLSPLLHNCFNADVFLHKFHNLSRIQNRDLELMYVDAKSRLPDSTLFMHESICRNLGADCIAPLLDVDLVEHLATLDPSARGLSGTENGLLRQLLCHWLDLPEDTVFPPSYIEAAPNERELLLSLAPRLVDAELVHAGLIQRSGMRRLLMHAQKKDLPLRQAWAVLVLEVYYRMFFNHPIGPRAPDRSLLEFLQES